MLEEILFENYLSSRTYVEYDMYKYFIILYLDAILMWFEIAPQNMKNTNSAAEYEQCLAGSLSSVFCWVTDQFDLYPSIFRIKYETQT